MLDALSKHMIETALTHFVWDMHNIIHETNQLFTERPYRRCTAEPDGVRYSPGTGQIATSN